MFGLNFSPPPALTRVAFLALVALAGCGGANSCCTVPSGVNQVGGVIPPGSGAPIVPTVPAVTVGKGGAGSVPVKGSGPFTAVGCPGIVNATVTGNLVNLVGVGPGTCVVVVTSPNGGKGTITVTVSPSPPLGTTPGTITLPPGGTGGITVTGPGPFTATGYPGIINATVTGNVVNLVAVGVGVCAVVITGPGGVQAIVVATVTASTPLAVNPGTIQLGTGGTGAVTITGTGPFTAIGCPRIVNASVTGNVLNLVGVGVGVCVVVVTDANGVKATVVATVAAVAPLGVTPTTINLGTGGTGSVAVTGMGPFTATGCPGIINATVTGNIVNVAAVGVGVCVVVITGPNGLQATVLATVSATAPPITVNPTTVQLAPGGSAGVTIGGTGPFTVTGCPGIVNATVSGNVVNLVGVSVGVCVVVVTGPGGVTATVLATVATTPAITLAPATVLLGNGETSPIAITGTGPFTATGCPGIINATVNGNVLNLAAVGVGVCAVVVAGPGGVHATVLATVAAATPLVATPATVNLLTIGATAPVTVTPAGSGPFTATGCPGIVNATVTGNVVNLTSTGIGVCAVLIAGAAGVQATALVTVT